MPIPRRKLNWSTPTPMLEGQVGDGRNYRAIANRYGAATITAIPPRLPVPGDDPQDLSTPPRHSALTDSADYAPDAGRTFPRPAADSPGKTMPNTTDMLYRPAVETAPRAAMPAESSTVKQNAIQRWTPTTPSVGSGVDKERNRFMARGGSSRSYNRARTAQGIRPRIDGRAASSPRNAQIAPVKFIKSASNWESKTGPDLPY